MTTDLKAQLQRLQTPQTSALVESKSRASILYEPKEAAQIDRKTIFDGAKQGLADLIKLNPAFQQFQNTLFDASAINLERSVEKVDVNKALDKTIKKFLLRLSPHFLIHPAHKCLEWLIRRYAIHKYNIDDLMGLILPYHETKMFVKCLQTIRFDDGKWYWMKANQKPGLPMAKQTIICRAADDNRLLSFISQTTLAAVNELQHRAHSLQALFAFYSTITLGALDALDEINESHISSIINTLSNGLSSDTVDFCAASMIIAALLMTKTNFEDTLLELVVEKLSKNLTRQELRRESLVLLILICRTQTDSTEMIVDALLSVDASLIVTTLGCLYEDKVDILPLCTPLIKKCLGLVENKKTALTYHRLIEMLLKEISFTSDDANTIIRCILTALQRTPKPKPKPSNTEVLCISDDDDDVEMGNDKSKEDQWNSNVMRILETRYAEVFDAVKTDIMSNQDEGSSSLKIVLGALLCGTYNADPSNANIFVDLHHPSAENRVHAVKRLVEMNKVSTMPYSDDKKNLLVAGIALRLSDDSPKVVDGVLKFETEYLIKIIGKQNLIKKLKSIIGEQFMGQKQWQNAISSAIKHITSEHLLSDDNEIEVFLAIWPYMFPLNDKISHHSEAIIESDICSRFPIVKKLKDVKLKDTKNHPMEYINKRLKNGFDKAKIGAIVQFVKSLPDAEMTHLMAFHVINLLTYSLPQDSDHKLSNDVLDLLSKFLDKFFWRHADIYQYAQDIYGRNRPEKLPIQLLLNSIHTIIERTDFSAVSNSSVIDFTVNSDELSLMLNLHRHLCNGLFLHSTKTSGLYNKAMSEFIRKVLPTIAIQLDFFSNFFINHHINQLEQPSSLQISAELQLRSMRLFNELLRHADVVKEITMEVFIRIISGLTSPFDAVRELTSETVAILNGLLDKSSRYSKFIALLVNDMKTLKMNPQQLSIFLFNTKQNRTELFEFIQRPASTTILKATLLDMLKIVGDGKRDSKYLNIAVNVALDVLRKVDYSQRVILNPHESMVVYHAIIRFDSDAISTVLTAETNCRTFFEIVLQQSNIFIDVDDKIRSIAEVAMGLRCFINLNKFSTNLQQFFINSIVKSATFSKTDNVRSKARYFFKKYIEFDGKMELEILTGMVNVTSMNTAKKEQVKCLSQDLLQTSEWKCGLTLLEFMQKKRMKNPRELMRQLLPVLKKCLDFDDQSMVEYTKQLLLIDILNCCELMPTTGPFVETDFRIELVIQCVSGTHNPSTHHHALELLARLAKMIPETVLHDITQIFTFIGNAVVKRDDDYIYQPISKIIKSIVPILKQNNIIHVLEVFSGNVIFDTPNHRRSALYEDLLKTLDPKKYLWVFLAIFFKADIVIDNTKLLKKPTLKRTQIAIEITNLFDCDIVIETCYQLIQFAQSQFGEIDDRTELTADLKRIFNPEHYDSISICVRYINMILNFITVLTMDKSEFSKKMASLEKKSLAKHKKTFEGIIPAILMFVKELSQSNIRKVEKSWIDGLGACYHILDHLLDLLYPDMLLQVVHTLLSEENEVEVRRKIVDLLNKKLETPELFTDCKDSILSLLEPLTNIVGSIIEKPTHSSLQIDALIAIQLLSNIIAKDHPDEFAELIKVLAKILQSYGDISIRLRAYLIQCLGVLCANLRIHTINHLFRFMEPITDVLNDLITRETDAVSPCFEIILTAIYRIVETVPLFLSPYLVKLITSLSILWSRLQTTPSNESQKNLLKLDKIWQKLASSLELRVLIPLIETHIYPDLLSHGKFNATGPLMELLLDSFEHAKSTELAQNCQELTTFFIGVLNFRSKFHRECTTVDVQEDFFIKTLIGFVLKLSEASFRPLYNKLLEWSNEEIEQSFDRTITFYRLSNQLAESLKSLFITFAPPIIQNSAELLTKSFTKSQIKASSAKPLTLIYNILSTLQTLFLYGTTFMNSHRFNVLMEPLVNLLDNEEYLADKNIVELLPKCLAQFAVSANNDLLWKQLNHQILMKTRSNSVTVRRCALICSVEVVVQLGEESTQLYPELIPFLSELLEDEDADIQKICNKSITEIEKVTGEELKKHL